MNMMRRWGLLLGVLLAGCASSGPSSATFQEAEREEADACLALLCDEALCGFFRCEDVAADVVSASEGSDDASAGPGRVVLARTGSTSTTVGINLPSPVTPMRYRGWPLRYPGEREPIFVIPWKNHHLRGGQREAEPASREAPHLPAGVQGMVQGQGHRHPSMDDVARDRAAPEHSSGAKRWSLERGVAAVQKSE